MALRCSIGAVIAACGLIIPLTAQPSQQAFEVASVKRAAKPGRLTFPVIGNGLFNVPSTTAGELIALAYELDRQQIVGGPRWLWSETFEIKARATDNMASLAQMRPMVRSLLQDRYKLVGQLRKQPLPHLELQFARPDKKLGSNAHPLEKCGPDTFTRFGKFPPGSQQHYACGSVTALVTNLTRSAGQLVTDGTGLKGEFAFVMHWMPEPRSGGGAATIPDLSALRAALRDQLGFRLEASRAPIDALVIESLQRPSEN